MGFHVDALLHGLSLCLPQPFKMDPRWFPPTDRPVYGPVGSPLLHIAGTCFVSLLIPPGLCRVALTTPVLLYLISRARTHSSGRVEEDYVNTVNIAVLTLKWVDFVVLHTPERDCHRVDQSKQDRPT